MSPAAHQAESEPLWKPAHPEKTNTFALLEFINTRYALTDYIRLSTYEDLYAFSRVRRSDFWKAVWEFCDVRWRSAGDDQELRGAVVDESRSPADNPAWFPGVEVCWAENMLRCAQQSKYKDKTALIQVGASLAQSQQASLARF